MDNIFVIDDELVDPNNTLRKDIEKFGKKYRYKLIFCEAPDPEALEDKLNKNRPITAVFLDIVHEQKQYNIASLLRKEIGGKIPILILTNYTKEDLKLKNKEFENLNRGLEKKTNFIAQSISSTFDILQDNNLKREIREPLSNKYKGLLELKDALNKYKKGNFDKNDLLPLIDSLVEYEDNDNFVDLKKLKVFLAASSVPNYFGSNYPMDFRQIIGYVLKDKFMDMQEQINNAIIASSMPDNSDFALMVSSPLIQIQDSKGNNIGSIKKNKSWCKQLKKFADSQDLYCQIHSEVERAYKIVSPINIGIYEATKWKLRDILKNEEGGKYKLDIGRFIVDGKVIKDFERVSQPIDLTKQLNEILTRLSELTDRVNRIENHQLKKE